MDEFPDPAVVPAVDAPVWSAYLTQGPIGRDAFHLAGDVVELATDEGGEPSQPLLVEKPDKRTAAAHWNDRTRAMEFTETEQPGVYTVKNADGKTVGMFAVNTESYESKLTISTTSLAGGAPDDDRRGEGRGQLRKPLRQSAAGGVRGRPRPRRRSRRAGDPNGGCGCCSACWSRAVAEPTLANPCAALLFCSARPRRPQAATSPMRQSRKRPHPAGGQREMSAAYYLRRIWCSSRTCHFPGFGGGAAAGRWLAVVAGPALG